MFIITVDNMFNGTKVLIMAVYPPSWVKALEYSVPNPLEDGNIDKIKLIT